jgi:hypothetical protein
MTGHAGDVACGCAMTSPSARQVKNAEEAWNEDWLYPWAQGPSSKWSKEHERGIVWTVRWRSFLMEERYLFILPQLSPGPHVIDVRLLARHNDQVYPRPAVDRGRRAEGALTVLSRGRLLVRGSDTVAGNRTLASTRASGGFIVSPGCVGASQRPARAMQSGGSAQRRCVGRRWLRRSRTSGAAVHARRCCSLDARSSWRLPQHMDASWSGG